MANSTHIFAIIFQVIDKATKSLKHIEKELVDVSKAVNEATSMFRGFQGKLLNLGLGMTFFMFGVQMQMKRMLRSMFTIFEQASGSSGALIEKFNVMRAQLGTLSIAFFDAFSKSGLMDILVKGAQSLTNWYLDLTDAQRSFVSSAALGALGVIFAINILGQTILALNTILALPAWVGWGALAALTIGLVYGYMKNDLNEAMKEFNNDLQKEGAKGWTGWFDFAVNTIMRLYNLIKNTFGKKAQKFFGFNPVENPFLEKINEQKKAMEKMISTAKIDTFSYVNSGKFAGYSPFNPFGPSLPMPSSQVSAPKQGGFADDFYSKVPSTSSQPINVVLQNPQDIAKELEKKYGISLPSTLT